MPRRPPLVIKFDFKELTIRLQPVKSSTGLPASIPEAFDLAANLDYTISSPSVIQIEGVAKSGCVANSLQIHSVASVVYPEAHMKASNAVFTPESQVFSIEQLLPSTPPALNLAVAEGSVSEVIDCQLIRTPPRL
ncbi:hypothetical protein Nepgr_028942 [Nepenthes gracilis]|uniref:Uncharacterized protein n=1 Tax=Nepenthes gracilis TaxID=150966 RepID=A0AAD3TD48_NEPGR|nr:hypothetical protein Nepgr_028942 [Nepenthes gracilis]